MLKIDFEKLSKISLLQADDKLSAFLDSPESTNLFIQWKKRNLNVEEQTQNVFLEMYGECLLKNYHRGLAGILKEQGIQITDSEES
jgi:hypothetical protein